MRKLSLYCLFVSIYTLPGLGYAQLLAQTDFIDSGKLNNQLKKKSVHLGGYVQTQFYVEDKPAGNIKTTTTESGFRIRRARIKVDGIVTESLDYEVQLNANESKVALEDANVTLHLQPWLNLKVGRFTIPFGYEISQSSSKNPFIERSRYWSYIFKERRNIGAMLSLKTGLVILEVSYFQTYGDNVSGTLEKDSAVKLTTNFKVFNVGMSGYYDQKETAGSISEVERKGSVFFTAKFKKVAAWLETSGQWDTAYTNTPIRRIGAALGVSVYIDDPWELVTRVSVLHLEDPTSVTAKEIGIGTTVTALAEKQTYSAVLGMNYHFAPKTKIMFNYNPTISDNQIASAFLLQVQAVF